MGRLLKSPFRPAWWLSNAHLQTLWPSLFRRRRPPALEAERLELDDGDFIDLSWVRGAQGPCVLVLHGLEGSLDSHYAGGTLSALAAAGYRPVFMYFRGCSGTPNRLPRGYHSGATEDLLSVLAHLAGRLGEPPFAAVGYSLGGNLLLKYLGERPPPIPLRAAVAISVPFRLGDAVGRLDRGFSRLYQRHLVGRLRASYQRKFATLPSPLGVDVARLRSFFAFDDQVTAPLHGFAGARDYYNRCSCRQFLAGIATPTLILHARDDPFMFPSTLPSAAELGPATTLEVSEGGGHVGFVSGRLPWRPRYWAEERLVAFLDQIRHGGSRGLV
ncbi:MAG: hydrolase [Chromatiaceae bacterium]|nr:hydrolase [Candidatus Thioaporhodococcus sediminis]